MRAVEMLLAFQSQIYQEVKGITFKRFRATFKNSYTGRGEIMSNYYHELYISLQDCP